MAPAARKLRALTANREAMRLIRIEDRIIFFPGYFFCFTV
jgi:hypothetical protein